LTRAVREVLHSHQTELYTTEEIPQLVEHIRSSAKPTGTTPLFPQVCGGDREGVGRATIQVSEETGMDEETKRMILRTAVPQVTNLLRQQTVAFFDLRTSE